MSEQDRIDLMEAQEEVERICAEARGETWTDESKKLNYIYNDAGAVVGVNDAIGRYWHARKELWRDPNYLEKLLNG